MVLYSCALLPVLFALISIHAVRGDRRGGTRALEKLLRERGFSTRHTPEHRLLLTGTVDGVALRVEQLLMPEAVLSLHGSSAQTAEVEPGEEDSAPDSEEPCEPEPKPSAEASERAVRDSLGALTKKNVEVVRHDDGVELRIAGRILDLDVVDHAVDAVVALCRRTPLGPPRDLTNVDNGRGRSGALLFAAIGSVMLTGLATSHLQFVRTLIEPFACFDGDRLHVLEEEGGQGTGYNLYCLSPDGRRHGYGQATGYVASIDVFMPLLYAGTIAGLWLNRRKQARRAPA